MLVSPRRRIRACRDPDDDYLLDLAVEAKATAIVTGDKDLLCLDPFRSVRIVGYRDLLEMLEDR
jgi:predicted nucleic acid-binding protein